MQRSLWEGDVRSWEEEEDDEGGLVMGIHLAGLGSKRVEDSPGALLVSCLLNLSLTRIQNR